MSSTVGGGAVRDVIRTVRMSEIWAYLALDDVIARYKRTLLGPLWNATYVLVTALSLAIVFGGLFNQPLQQILPFILAGFLAWNLGPGLVIEASGLFTTFSGQIKSSNLPYFFYVMRAVARGVIFFAHHIAVFWVVLLILRVPPWVHWSLLPAVVLVVVATIPYMLLMAMVSARFRDIQLLVANLGGVLFFVTPIFWNPDNLQGWRAGVVLFNPLHYFVDLVRRALLNQAPPAADWLVVLGAMVIGYALCAVCFSLWRRRIPFWV